MTNETKMNKNRLRQRYFIDSEVQTGLLKRIVFYWIAGVLFVTLPIAFARTLSDPNVFFMDHIKDVFILHWPMLVMLLFLLPFAMNDAIKFSNRFAGPIFRLRCELKNFENGGKLRPVIFRKGDYWHDLANGFNQLTERLNELEQAQESDSTGSFDSAEVGFSQTDA